MSSLGHGGLLTRSRTSISSFQVRLDGEFEWSLSIFQLVVLYGDMLHAYTGNDFSIDANLWKTRRNGTRHNIADKTASVKKQECVERA